MNIIAGKITSWGTHEDKTVAQIQRCSHDERVVRAAPAQTVILVTPFRSASSATAMPSAGLTVFGSVFTSARADWGTESLAGF
jgi:hypothetical protein